MSPNDTAMGDRVGKESTYLRWLALAGWVKGSVLRVGRRSRNAASEGRRRKHGLG